MKKLSPRQREALAIVADGAFYPSLVKEDGQWHARWLALSGDNHWVDEYVRGFSITRMTEDAEDLRHETLHDAWITALRSQTGRVVWDEAEIRVCRRTCRMERCGGGGCRRAQGYCLYACRR